MSEDAQFIKEKRERCQKLWDDRESLSENWQKRDLLESLWDKRADEGMLRYDERQEMHRLSIDLGDIPKDVGIDEFCYNLKLFGKVYGNFN